MAEARLAAGQGEALCGLAFFPTLLSEPAHFCSASEAREIVSAWLPGCLAAWLPDSPFAGFAGWLAAWLAAWLRRVRPRCRGWRSCWSQAKMNRTTCFSAPRPQCIAISQRRACSRQTEGSTEP